MVKKPTNATGEAGDMGLIPGSGRSPGVGSGTQSSILDWKAFMDRGAWRVAVHGAAKSQTRLKQLSTNYMREDFLEKISLKKIVISELYNVLESSNFKILDFWTSLVAQWIGICLPMQETQVLSLVWEDSTCYGATKTCVPQPLSPHSKAHEPQLLCLCS